MGKNLQKILKIILLFKNWPLRFMEMAKLLAPQETQMKLRNGLSFIVRPYSSDISCLQSIVMEGEYSRYFNVLPGDIVIDIGANIGSFTVSAAYREPTARFFSIEPMQNNFEMLNKNISINKLANVTTLKAGISDKKEMITFYHGKGTWFASGSLYNIGAVNAESKEETQCLTLADIFDEYKIDTCDFLKMDCEGAEYKILFNLSDDVFRKIKKMAIEFHNFEQGKNQHDIVKLLEDKGYKTILSEKYKNKNIGLIFGIKK